MVAAEAVVAKAVMVEAMDIARVADRSRRNQFHANNAIHAA
jgi:hypothetical protein